jgi:ribosomal protein S8
MVLFTFLHKKTKKLFKFYTIIAQLNWSIKKKQQYFFFFIGHYSILFLEKIRQKGFIFDFLLLPLVIIKNYITKKFFINLNIGIVFFNNNKFFGNPIYHIKIISKPSRSIFVTYKNLLQLHFWSTQRHLYMLHTNRGLLTYEQAVFYKIGGILLCKVV